MNAPPRHAMQLKTPRRDMTWLEKRAAARATERTDDQQVLRAVTRLTRPAVCLVLLLSGGAALAALPGAAAIDARVRAAMGETCANGMAIAVIDDGRVAYV